MNNIYLGREPIIDKTNSLYAYEILYKDTKNQINVDSTRRTSAGIINAVLNKFGTQSLLGKHKAFVKIDEKFLLDDLIFAIPKEFFIFSFPSSVDMRSEVVERIKELHKKGYKLAIDDAKFSEISMPKYNIILQELSYVKFELDNFGIRTMEFIKQLKAHEIDLIAININDSKTHRQAKELGCEYFQGYFFAEPKILDDGKYNPSHTKILQLYNLLRQESSISEITAAFEDAHEITVELLKFINSGAFHFRNRISSIHHILTLVGRKPLTQWLMLMIYSKSMSHANEMPPLLLMVKNRTELIEKILKLIQPNASEELLGEAYFVGVLSLIDVVMGVELKRILHDMLISSDIENALLKNEGILGDIYMLVKEIEAFNTNSIESFKKKYNIKDDTIESIVLQSIQEVNEFENPTQE